MSNEDTEIQKRTVKVIIVGEAGVGKTSISNRYVYNNFCDNYVPTLGCSSLQKKLYMKDYNMEITIEIWDTAGQEKYQSLSNLFFQNAEIAILVYDISRKKSYESIKSIWLPKVKSIVPNTVIGIAANKSDLIDKEQVNEEEVNKFSQENNIYFFPTSAKKNIGIHELFNGLCKNLLDGKNAENKNDNIKIKNEHTSNDEGSTKSKKNCCK